MASLSDTLIANGAQELNKGVDISGSITSGVQAGVQLATAQEQVEQKKIQVADQRMELQTKQATAMMNRTKAAMFAQSPAAFDSIMKANKAYADSIQVPYNDEALRAAYKDPSLRLAAQKEVNAVMNGGTMKNPQAVIDFFGSDSPAIFDHLQNVSYKAGVVQQGQEADLKKQGAHDASSERIARINADSRQPSVNLRATNQNNRTLLQSNRLYLKEVSPFEELISSADSAKSIIDDIRSGGITANPNIKADVEDTLSRLSSRKSTTTVSGADRHAFDSLYNRVVSKLNFLKGTSDGVLPKAQLDELDRDINAFDAIIGKQHEIAFKSFLAKQPETSRQQMIDGYNEKRSGYGLGTIDGGSPQVAPTAPQAPAQSADSNLDAFLQTLPKGADPVKATAAYYKIHPKPVAGQ